MTYQICTKTVLDTSYPGISFDNEGRSSLFLDYQNNVQPYLYSGESSEAQLEVILDKIKCSTRGKQYNCILGLSGGLDSSYLLHKVVTEYDLKPLVFHVDAGWNTDTSAYNIKSLVNKLDLDLFTEVIKWSDIRNFQLALFRAGVPHLDVPQDLAFISVLYKYAQKFNIKTILNGGNIASEAILTPLKYYYWGSDTYHYKQIIKRFSSSRLDDYPFSNAFYHKFFLKYFRGVNVIKPLNFLDFNKSRAIAELTEIYGWRSYPQKHFESRFTRFLEGYWLPTRFSFDIRRIQLSSLILSDQLSRQEALKSLSSLPLSASQISNECQYISDKLNISVDELESFHQLPLSYYYDYPNMSRLFGLGEYVLSKISNIRRGGAL